MTHTSLDRRPLSRREFLRLGGLAIAGIGALLAGCRPSASDQAASGDSIVLNREDAPATATPIAQAKATQDAVRSATPLPQQTAPSGRAVSPTATPAAAQAVYVACPRGLVNDPYPGHCKLYRDSNNNGYCDWSVPGSGNVLAGPAGVPGGDRPRR